MTPPDKEFNLPLCRLNTGCPVPLLHQVTVDTPLSLVSAGNVGANFLRGSVRINTVKFPDDEAVQQDNSAISRPCE